MQFEPSIKEKPLILQMSSLAFLWKIIMKSITLAPIQNFLKCYVHLLQTLPTIQPRKKPPKFVVYKETPSKTFSDYNLGMMSLSSEIEDPTLSVYPIFKGTKEPA